jgi:4,5-dihydroxyphthalate decarboxylase
MLEFSLACQITDRTRALVDGRVSVGGCRINFVHGPAEELFQRAFRHEEFDISELSLGTHLLTTSRGQSRYSGVPAFVSRSFRHSAIYVRADHGINSAEELRGRKVGVPDFQQTAGVWVRGFLDDEHGVRTRDVHWFTGGLEQAGRQVRMPLDLPPDIRIVPIDSDATLSKLLDSGDIDAIIAPRPPSCFGQNPNVRRLFPHFREAEEAYFTKTRLFPLMHIIGIRRSLVERYPWLPVNVFAAFVKAKETAMTELTITDTLRIAHPWINAEVDRVKALMGDDYWRYGLDANRPELAALQRYARTDGLIGQEVPLEQLFAATTFDGFNF